MRRATYDDRQNKRAIAELPRKAVTLECPLEHVRLACTAHLPLSMSPHVDEHGETRAGRRRTTPQDVTQEPRASRASARRRTAGSRTPASIEAAEAKSGEQPVSLRSSTAPCNVVTWHNSGEVGR